MSSKIINMASTEISNVLQEIQRAIQTKNADSIAAHYADDVILFDVMGPLQNAGIGLTRQRMDEWMGYYEGPIQCEMQDISIAASDTIAFCHSLNRLGGKLKQGIDSDMWVRSTLCFRKINNRWLITHEHVSEPFDASGKASLDLTP